MSPPPQPIPRDERSIENFRALGLFEVKLSNPIGFTRPDPNPWREAVRISTAADPSPRPIPPPSFSLFDGTENHPAANMNDEDEVKGIYWWLFGGNIRFSDVGTSTLLPSTLLVVWRVLIFALSLAAAIISGIFAPQPKAFLLPVSHALLAAISVRMIDLAAKKDDEESALNFTYSIDAALYRAAQIIVISAGSHLLNIFQFGPQFTAAVWLTYLLTFTCVMDVWFSAMPCSLAAAALAFILDMILVIFTVYLVNDGTLSSKSFGVLIAVSVLVTTSFCFYNNAVYYCFHKTASRGINTNNRRDAAEKV